MVGVSSIWAFMGHVFDANAVATVIGWPPDSPFQYEVGIANLAFGVLGLLCLKIRENFWVATINRIFNILPGSGLWPYKELPGDR